MKKRLMNSWVFRKKYASSVLFCGEILGDFYASEGEFLVDFG